MTAISPTPYAPAAAITCGHQQPPRVHPCEVEMEEWREIPGYPGYEVSDMGRVRSWRHKTGRRVKPWILKPSVSGGYLQVVLMVGGARQTILVHRAVLLAFVGDPPHGDQSSHINGKRDDNRASNLKWEDPKTNSRRKAGHGTQCRGETHGHSKLTGEHVKQMRMLHGLGASFASIGRSYGVTDVTARRAVLYITWRHVQ